MKLNVTYDQTPDGIHIKIFYRKTMLDEAIIRTANRNDGEIANKKIMYAMDFCKAHPEIIMKDVLKAFAAIDEIFLNLYKKQYPRGGNHGGGRPKNSERTVQFGQRITPAEKEFLLNQLKRYRERAAAGINLKTVQR